MSIIEYNTSWPLAKFKDVAKVVTGSTPSTKKPEYHGGDIPFIKPGDLKEEGVIVNKAENYVTELGAEQGRLLPQNSVMVCCIGSLGKVGFSTKPLITNQQINSLVFDENEVYPKYGYYYCTTIQPILEHIAPTTTVAIVNKTNFSDLKIPLPPLQTQKKIAAVLDKANALRQKRRQTIEKLDELTQSVFLEMFGDPLVNPKSFPTKKALEIIKVNPRKPRNLNTNDKELISFLPMDAVSEKGSQFDYEEKRPFKEVNSGYTFFKKGDVLLAKITPCLENGKSCIANIETDFGFGSTEFHVFEPNDELLAEYLYHFISNDNFLKTAEEKMTGSAGQQRVPTDWVKSIELPIPPIEMQNDFRDKNLKLQSQEVKLKLSLQKLNSLFNALLQKAFKGELQLSGRPDELVAG